MKRIIVAIALVTMLMGATVRAQDLDLGKARSEAGSITPDNIFWHRFDVFVEDVRVIFTPTWRAKVRYLDQRMKERRAEALLMLDQKKSADFREALGLKNDHQAEMLDLIKEHSPQAYKEYQDILKSQTGNDAAFQEAISTSPEKALLHSRINDLRGELAEARKNGNSEKAIGVLKDLEKVKADAKDFQINEDAIRLSDELTAEHIEDFFTGNDKLELVAMRAIAEKKWATDAGDAADAQQLDALIVQAKQTAVAAIAKDVDAIVQKLQALIHDAERAVRNQAATERMQRDVEDKRVTPPQETKKPTEVPKKAAVQPKAPEAPKKAETPHNQPAPTPKLEPIPSETVVTEPLVLNYYLALHGEVGTYFSAQYGAGGGLPPYHFQLETAGGFPPIGLILDANGLLSGTPKANQTSTFSVCVVDTAGASVCAATVMTIDPAPEAPPPPPPPPEPDIETSISVTSTSCPDGLDMHVTGTARGPVGSTVNIHYGDNVSCGAWSVTSSDGCRRGAGQSDTAEWTFSFYKGLVSGDEQQISILGPGDDFSKKVRYEKNCP